MEETKKQTNQKKKKLELPTLVPVPVQYVAFT